MLVSPKQTVVHFTAPKCREVGEVHDVFCASTEQAVKASVFLHIAYNLRVLEMRLVSTRSHAFKTGKSFKKGIFS